MRARSAMIEALQRAAIIRIAQRRPCPDQLVERHGAVEDVAAGESEYLLEVERAQGLAADDACLEAGRVALDGFDHEIGDALAVIVPRRAIRQLRRHVLAEQACNVRS